MRPSEQLLELTLDDGWKVIRYADRAATATGGKFSTGYIVQNVDGRVGFLKAMDYTDALQQPNTAEILQHMTSAYLFEKQICDKCRDYHLNRVVHAIGSGSIHADKSNPAGKVEYLIFELAKGDIRTHLDTQNQFDLAFALRTLHNVATGLWQLHGSEMAHQDLKPSNVLVFTQGEGQKIGDLGRSWSRSIPAPHDDFTIAGDRGYAPPELLYQSDDNQTIQGRYACDLYLFGSLIVFLFSRTHLNGLLVEHLDHDHRPYQWEGSFKEVLPYVRDAFHRATTQFSMDVTNIIRDDLLEVVRQLCEPDPLLRGHPLNRRFPGNQYSLERYIARFNLLATRAEYRLLGNT